LLRAWLLLLPPVRALVPLAAVSEDRWLSAPASGTDACANAAGVGAACPWPM
jgi:hypothetical protein